jgi:hypothetical protein
LNVVFICRSEFKSIRTHPAKLSHDGRMFIDLRPYPAKLMPICEVAVEELRKHRKNNGYGNEDDQHDRVFPGSDAAGTGSSVLMIRVKQIASERALNAPFIHRSDASGGMAK